MSRRATERGVSLVEALVAIVILSFGVLGLARFQIGMLAQGTDSQQRLAASALTDEILAVVRADLPNVVCYNLPHTGLCNSAFATAQVDAWTARVKTNVTGFTSATIAPVNANQVKVTINWLAESSATPHSQEATTDVRP